jgi:ankyrin repeat domain-containing protein 50
LETLPSGVYATYEDAFNRIKDQSDDDAQLAMKVVSYVFCAKRPLKVEELLHALAVEAGDTELDETAFSEVEILLSVSAGLVAVDEEGSTIRLVHYTLQEYLEKNRERLVPDADLEMAKECLTYLLFDIFKSGPCNNGEALNQRLREYRFLDYASRNWGHHVRENQQPELIDRVLRYLEDDQKMSCFVQIVHVSTSRYEGWHDYFPKQFNLLHAVAYWGLIEMLAVLPGPVIDINSRDSYGRTALHLGTRNGHETMVRVLLEKGADISGKDQHGSTALHRAARAGHTAVARVLLEKGANVEATDENGKTSAA